MRLSGLLFLFYIILNISMLAQYQQGTASYYADKFHGRKTASGVPYHKDSMMAAHRTLPFGTFIRVTSLKDSSRSVVLKVTDRGPYGHGRIVDVSRAAAEQLNMIQYGVIPVTIELVDSTETYQLPDSVVVAATEPLPAPNPPTIAPVLSEGFVIQVGSYVDATSAQRLAANVQQSTGFQAFLHIGQSPYSQYVYRVLVGPYRERIQADAVLLELSQRNFGGFVISLQNLR